MNSNHLISQFLETAEHALSQIRQIIEKEDPFEFKGGNPKLIELRFPKRAPIKTYPVKPLEIEDDIEEVSETSYINETEASEASEESGASGAKEERRILPRRSTRDGLHHLRELDFRYEKQLNNFGQNGRTELIMYLREISKDDSIMHGLAIYSPSKGRCDACGYNHRQLTGQVVVRSKNLSKEFKIGPYCYSKLKCLIEFGIMRSQPEKMDMNRAWELIVKCETLAGDITRKRKTT